MEYEISVDEKGGYINIVVTGNMTNKFAMEINIRAHELGRKTNIGRFLMDLRQSRNTDDVIQNYNFAYKDMKVDDRIDRKAIVALLVSPDDNSHDFIETVSINTGLNVRKFTDSKKAKEYLAGKKQ